VHTHNTDEELKEVTIQAGLSKSDNYSSDICLSSKFRTIRSRGYVFHRTNTKHQFPEICGFSCAQFCSYYTLNTLTDYNLCWICCTLPLFGVIFYWLWRLLLSRFTHCCISTNRSWPKLGGSLQDEWRKI